MIEPVVNEQTEAVTMREMAQMCFRRGMACACGKATGTSAGEAGSIDYIAAHKWFNLAAMSGNERAADYRREIAASMSQDDIAAALRAAREWISRSGSGRKM